MKVERINLDGKLGIVNSARVSFGAWKTELDDKDKKLIEFLRKHKHHSPFYHGSLQDYARICSLRLKEDSQKETRDCVQMIYELCKAEYPNTFDKLIKMYDEQ